MGNTVLWKPASNAVFSGFHLMKLFKEAGFPDGVINLVYGSGGTVGEGLLNHPNVHGVTFTGSNEVGCGVHAQGARQMMKELAGTP